MVAVVVVAGAECEAGGSIFEATNGTTAAPANASSISCCAADRVPAAQNLLCARCKKDYTEWSGRCVYCPETHYDVIFVMLLLSLLCKLLPLPSNRLRSILWLFCSPDVIIFNRISQTSGSSTKIVFCEWMLRGALSLQPAN